VTNAILLIPESPHYHHRFTFYDPASTIEFTDLIEIHTLELLKLPETADNYLWLWLRFLRAESREDLNMVAQASPNLGKVVVKLLELSEDEEARMIYEAEIKQQRDDRARLRGALEQGIAEGKIIIARKLLKQNIPIDTIVEATDLSRDVIEKL
jgi:predicted transposase/invertase (TIGR01784 family)